MWMDTDLGSESHKKKLSSMILLYLHPIETGGESKVTISISWMIIGWATREIWYNQDVYTK